MSNIYEITADDGNGEVVKVNLSREKLCQMIGNSLYLGVIASAMIEGEEVDDINISVINDLPEAILIT